MSAPKAAPAAADAAPDRLPGPVGKVTPEHARDVLEPRGLTAQDAETFGVYSVLTLGELPEEFQGDPNATVPGLVIPWTSQSGATVLQYRPDNPVTDEKTGRKRKYLSPPGGTVLALVKQGAPGGPVLYQEGTFQSLVAAKYAPEDVTVYAVAGCRNWSKNGVPDADLAEVEGRDVFVSLDADAATNSDVYAAGEALKRALTAEGATSVKFVQLPAGKNAGLDDVLGKRAEDKRAPYVARLLAGATAKPADRKPPAKSKATDESAFFGDTGSLRVEVLATAVTERFPAALTEERRVALYRDGVYRIDGSALIGAVTELLGDEFRTGHRSNVQEYLVGSLSNAGRFLPMHVNRPLLNVRNGMLDLTTGELLLHSPDYLSSVQFPVEWDPDAVCLMYDRWLSEVIPDQAEDLEEVTAGMLDPSQTPTKAVFLYGPSRSGKSTFLRLMQAMAGQENTSAVTLHQLSTDRFTAANVFGKALNVASDMKAADVEDVSIFKMMTGNDPIQANRKYGSQFTFRNGALFAFGGNSLPAVAESSRAYSERVKPFKFAHSFAGREDPSIEDAMTEELPGILVRWVKAWQRRQARGAYLSTLPAVREEFEIGSDRVRQFVATACTVHPTEGAVMPDRQVAGKRELHRAFMRWADEQRGGGMNESKFGERLGNIAGVRGDVRTETTKRRGYNVTVRPSTEWGQDADESQPVAKVANTAYPLPDARTLSQSTADEKCVSGRGKGKAVSATSATSSAVVAYLTAHAVTVPPPECPDCDRPEELVPPTNFWHACRSCHPDTFSRA